MFEAGKELKSCGVYKTSVSPYVQMERYFPVSIESFFS